MSDTDANTVKSAIKRWHAIVAAGDIDALATMIHPDAMFRSPAVYKPYHSRDALMLALTTVFQVFENFTYHREFIDEEGGNAVLEFSANVGERELKGVDIIKFNDEGLIVEFEVMVRPASGLMALAEQMGGRLGDKLNAYK